MRAINTQSRLMVVAALFLVCSANSRFFIEVFSEFPFGYSNFGFLISLPVVLGCVLVLLLLPFAGRYTLKPAITVMLLIAAPVAYFSDQVGTVFDETMIRNTLETNSREALDLFSFELMLRVLLLAVLPIVLLWKVPMRYRGWRRELLGKSALFGLVVLASTGLVLAFYSHYASFAREYKILRYYTNPVTPLYSAGLYWFDSDISDPGLPVADMGKDARLPLKDSHRELMILVIGETARADRFSLYGYARDTNPLLSKQTDLTVYTEVQSCGTSTAISVPCMFSFSDRAHFSVKSAGRSENVLDVLQHVGVSILWRDNNSGSKGVALRVPYEDYSSADVNPVCDPECRDFGMLRDLEKYIDAQDHDVLIVLHQMGNHGPAYYKRYPANFEYFSPACRSDKLSDCSSDEINNAYDNAIRYTDWFLAQVIALLKKYSGTHETGMLYVSDHGESLGENNLYLHGMPYALAPTEQTSVPMLFWSGTNEDISSAVLSERATRTNSHDVLVHSLLEFYEISTELRDDNAGIYGPPADE